MTSFDARICRICGYLFSGWSPWGEDGQSPTFDFCPCCGVEFGYQDSSLAGVRRWRDRWLRDGAQWSDSYVESDGLEADARMSRVPEEFR